MYRTAIRAKVAIAATAAVLTLTGAVAAALVLPSGGGASDHGVLQSAGLHAGGAIDAGTSTTATPTGEHADAGTSTPVPSPTPSANVSAGAAGTAAVTTPTTPLPTVPLPTVPTSLPIPGGGALPDLSGLTDIPDQVLACLEPIFDLVAGMPAFSMDQIMSIGPTIVGCVSEIVANLPLPFGMNACISEIMGFVSGMTSSFGMGIPDFGDFDISACIPSGLPVPTNFFSGFMGGGGLPFGR